MLAKEVMTQEVFTVRAQTSIRSAIELMMEHRISGLIVVDENMCAVGVVSEKDLLIAYDFCHKLDEPIGEFISREVIDVGEETPIEDISRLLVQHNIKRVPVLRERKVVGVVSRRDILKYFQTLK
jgi:CBS domain-containing protein